VKRTRRGVDVGTVLLGLLACGTLVLSVAALRSHTGAPVSAAEPIAYPSSSTTSTTATSSPDAAGSGSPSASASAVAVSTSTSPSAGTVVVLGDGNSTGDTSTTWIGTAAQQLGWSDVVNLSAGGRGYVKPPRSCSSTSSPCANFEGSISTVVKAHPDVVVTFGGTADGDYDLTPLATKYFADLRRALPNATLVAVSPVTTESTVPYYLTLNTRAISTAAKKSGAIFINIGQPGRGDGANLSAKAQAAIADKIVAGLS